MPVTCSHAIGSVGSTIGHKVYSRSEVAHQSGACDPVIQVMENQYPCITTSNVDASVCVRIPAGESVMYDLKKMPCDDSEKFAEFSKVTELLIVSEDCALITIDPNIIGCTISTDRIFHLASSEGWQVSGTNTITITNPNTCDAAICIRVVGSAV